MAVPCVQVIQCKSFLAKLFYSGFLPLRIGIICIVTRMQMRGPFMSRKKKTLNENSCVNGFSNGDNTHRFY